MFALALLLACKTTIDAKPADDADDTDDTDLATDTDPPAADDTDAPPADDTDAPPADDTDLPTFEPGQAFLYVDFGYDPDAIEAVPYTFDGSTADPTFTFIVSDATWEFDFTETERWCMVQLSTGPAGRASWAVAPYALFGFQLPGSPDVFDACQGRLDMPAPGNFADGLAALTWGLAIAPGVYPPLAAYLTSVGYTEADLAGFTGGFLFGDVALAAEGGPFPMVLVSAYEMGASGDVATDSSGNPIALDASEMITAGELQRAWYSANVLISWRDIAAALAR